MMRFATIVLFSITVVGSDQTVTEPPVPTEYCTLVDHPEYFIGKVVVFRPRLTELKNGEWGLDSDCMRPMLLVFPRDVVPRPDFDIQPTSGLDMLLQAQRERRVLFRADFVGRFDSTGSTSQPRGARTGATFGKSKLTMRFVLRDVLKPERIVIPRR
jgi:hypothetical protein